MTAVEYATGFVAVLLATAAALGGGDGLRRRFVPGWSGAPAALAGAVLAVSLFVVLCQALGVVGLLERLPLVVASVLAGVGFQWWGRTTPASDAAPPPAVESPTPPTLASSPSRAGAVSPLLVALALVGAVLVVGQWSAHATDSLDGGIRDHDSLYYHLPTAARYAQTGSLTDVHFSEPDPQTAYYPANAEVLHAAAMVLFGGDVLSPVLNLGWAALALLAGWCLAGPRRGPLGVLAVAAVLGMPVLAWSQAGSALNDVAGMALVVASAAMLAHDRAHRAAVAVAGLSAGLAVGTKLTMLAPALALTVILALTASGSGRRRLGLLGVWAGALVVGGGFWYVRNLALTGNPLPWLALPGLPSFEPPGRQHSILEYVTSAGFYRDFVPGAVRVALGPARWLFLPLLAGGVALVVMNARDRFDRLLAGAAAVLGAVYLATPQTAGGPKGIPTLLAFNTRYAAPALALGLLALARASVVEGRWKVGLGALLFLVVCAEQLGERSWPDWEPKSLAPLAAGAALVGATLVLAWRPRTALALVAVVPIALGLAGKEVVDTYVDRRYATAGRDVAATWQWARQVRGERIAVAGLITHYPLVGVDVSNEVRYVGVAEPHGGFGPAPSCRAWRQALVAGRYSWVVTAPPPFTDVEPPEAAWTRRDPAVREVLRAGKASVFRIDGRIDPSKCGDPSGGAAEPLVVAAPGS